MAHIALTYGQIVSLLGYDTSAERSLRAAIQDEAEALVDGSASPIGRRQPTPSQLRKALAIAAKILPALTLALRDKVLP